MIEKIKNLLNGSYCIPKILLSNYKKLNIDEKSLIVLIYLLNNKNNIFNPIEISEVLNITLPEVLEIIEKLNNSDILDITTNKNNGVIEERFDLSNLYNKLAYQIINEETKETEKTSIYDNFEQEFGRTLSSIEYELISGWINGNFTEEIILCALKEAVYNGVNNLRYIDKILYEWNKKGIKTKEQVELDKKKFKMNDTPKQEMFDYDWLNDEK